MSRGTALGLLGRIVESRQALQTAIPLAESAGDLETLARALNNLGTGYFFEGAFEQSRAYHQRALEVVERTGDPAKIGPAISGLGRALLYLGEWKEARAHFERERSVVGSLGSVWFAPYPLFFLGQLSLREGNWEEAFRYLVEAGDLAERYRNLQALVLTQLVLAEMDLLTGEGEAALARLESLLARPGMEPFETDRILPHLAWAYLETGQEARAEETALRAISTLVGGSNRLALVDARRVLARIWTRMGRWEDARECLEEALTLTRAMPYPYGEGRILSVYGVLHARKGEADQARARLEAALAIYKRLGARKDVEWTEQALAGPALGHGPYEQQ
jgi:tetratricopeptide (TPR) repeat protein